MAYQPKGPQTNVQQTRQAQYQTEFASAAGSSNAQQAQQAQQQAQQAQQQAQQAQQQAQQAQQQAQQQGRQS